MSAEREAPPVPANRTVRVARDVFDLRQAREWFSAYVVRRNRSFVRQLGVARRLRLGSRLPGAPGRGEIWAVGTVRDEADVVEAVVRHLLAQGVDRVLVSDQGSTDGTRELLDAMAANDARVHVVDDRNAGHFQMEKVTALAHRAWWHGAAWIVPFDADEIWFAEDGTLAEALRRSPCSVLTARVLNAVPTHPEGTKLDACTSFVVDVGRSTGAVSASAPKIVFRAHPLALVGPGNHGVDRHGPRGGGLVIVHVPYRDRSQVARKFRQGARSVAATGDTSNVAWHWRAGAAMNDTEVDAAWSKIRIGEPVPEIGWPRPTDRRSGNVLAWAAWPGELDDR